jgi:predicted glutamine amidotransferase
MCRWSAYLGDPIWLSEFLTAPSHSLIRQSYRAKMCSTPLSGDGFGMVWYPLGSRSAPGRLRVAEPAWNNLNLLDVARGTQGSLIMAHVRSATVGVGVAERDCHPFVVGNLAFMHNGSVARFAQIRRVLLSRLSDESFGTITGVTDSEHVFALFQDHYRKQASRGVDALAAALRSTILEVLELSADAGCEETTVLNIAVADGDAIVCSRVARGDGRDGSLFYREGGRYCCAGGACTMDRQPEGEQAAIVTSEPLSAEGVWDEVPTDSLALLEKGQAIRFLRL